MSLHNHREELRKKLSIILLEFQNIKAEHDNIKREMRQWIEKTADAGIITLKEQTNYEDILSRLGNIVNENYAKILKELQSIKQDFDNRKFLYDDYKRYILSLPKIKTSFQSFSEAIAKTDLTSHSIDKNNANWRNRFDKLIDRCNDLEEIFNKLIDIITSDRNNIFAKKQDKPFLKLFSHQYRAKIKSKVNIGNKIVDLQVRSIFTIEDGLVNKKPIRDKLEEFIELYEKTPINQEQRDNRISYLSVINDHQMQDMIIKLVHNTIVLALKSAPELIRVSKANIYINVYTEEYTINPGQYLPKSYYNNIFINLQVTQTILYRAFQGFETMPTESDDYRTILHEITHSYDWISNNPVTRNITYNDEIYRVTWSIIGEEPYPQTLAYARLLTDLRGEGLADISAIIKSQIPKYVAAIIDVRETLKIFNEDKMLPNLTNEVYSNNYSDMQVIDQVHALYSTGSVHEWGRFMAFIVLIHKLSQRVYFLVSEKPLPNEAIKDLTHGLRDFDNIKMKYSLIVIKAEDLGEETRKRPTKHIYLVISRDDKELVDQFIVALSLMHLDKFLEHLENALKFTNIDEKGISRGIMKAINRNIKARLSKKVYEEGFEWNP